MRVLVTGGAGFIGSHLVDRLVEAGDAVVIFDRFEGEAAETKRSNITAHLESGAATLVEGSIVSDEALRVVEQYGPYDCIVHLAAHADIQESIANPEKYIEANLGGTVKLLDLARRMQVPQFVFGSSASVYGANDRVPYLESDAATRPLSPYAATKLAGEVIGYTYAHLYGIRVVCLRIFNAYGPRQRTLSVYEFASKVLREEKIVLFSPDTNTRDYTHVADVVAGIRKAMQYSGSAYEIVNLGSGNETELRELITLIGDVAGVAPIVERGAARPGYMDHTYADISKARKLLSYEPAVTLRDGLQTVIEHLRSGDR